MIGYVTVGTNDFGKALAFYDALFDTIGINRLWNADHMAAWGASRAAPALSIVLSHDGSGHRRQRHNGRAQGSRPCAS
jgi:hypothetical protein